MGSRAPFILLTLFLGACQAESCKPQEVGLGVARLTVRNAGALTRLIDRDTRCGFNSEAVLGSPVIEGQPGTVGTATWRVSDCALSFPSPTTALETCAGVQTRVEGRATLSGTRVVKGTVTGNPKNPIIPLSDDAVRVTLVATLDDFAVRSTANPSALTINSGRLSWVAEPRLAVSASKGVCAVATPNVTFTGLSYENATVFVESNGRQFPAEIASSNYSAQVGQRGEKENWLAGELTVFGKTARFPGPGEQGLADPTYDSAAFLESFACTADLKLPLDYACPSLDDRIAQGASRLTVSLFGRLVDFFDEEKRCGFASAPVLASPILSGNPGERGGSATWTVSGCSVTFAVPTAVKTDCFGATTWLTGTVSMSGTKKVRGILTGDPAQAVIPTSRDPGLVEASFAFTNLRLSDSVSANELTVLSGSLSGSLSTRTALNTDLGACSIKTPIATMSQLKYQDAKLVLGSDGSAFSLSVSSSSLDAQSGTKDGRSNTLSGTLVLDGKSVSIPTGGGEPILDPGFNQAHFDGAYACNPKLKIAASEEECAFTAPLAAGTARLIIQSVGALGSMVNKDSSCGFDATSVKLRPSEVVGQAGEQGSMSWKITGCQLGQAAPAQLDQDCGGARRMISGAAAIDARRTVNGLREKRLLVIDSIVPTTREAVVLELTSIQLTNLAAWSLPLGAAGPTSRLTLHSGTLSAIVKPVLGERLSEPGTFDVATPVSSITTVKLTNARVTLESGPKRFVFSIPSAELTAFNGSFKGSTNFLQGSIQIDGAAVSLPSMPLNPDFSQSALDASYACTPDLKAVVPPGGP